MNFDFDTVYLDKEWISADMSADHDIYDLCSIYYFRDDPPPELVEAWEDKAYNQFAETVMRKIGNTWYYITTDCGGTETLDNKVKRLIFTDPIPEKMEAQR